MLLFQLSQPLPPYVYTVMVPLPPTVERLSPIEQDKILIHQNYSPQIVSIIEPKIDKMILTDTQIENLNVIVNKLENGSITLDEAILKLRAGQQLTPLTKILFKILLSLIIKNRATEGFTNPYFGYQYLEGRSARIPPKLQENPLNRNPGSCKNAPNNSETVVFFDGFKAKIGNRQLDHILVKHGDQWNINDIDLKGTEDANRNLAPGVPEQVRTRLTPQNRRQLKMNLQDMASNSKLEVFPNYPISGGRGRAYLCPNTGLFFGIDENNIIRKAYIASRELVNHLRKYCT
nr:hypothetical protein [Cylindrotheca closterium]